MPPRKKEAGSLTNSKRFKEEKQQQQANSLGSRAQAIANAAGTVLSGAKNDSGQNRVLPPLPTALAPQTQTGNGGNSANSRSLAGLDGVAGYIHTHASGTVERKTDPYGGVTLPKYDFAGMVPTDLLNPQIQLQATEEQLTNGLAQYAAGTRAQHLLQAGFKYLEEVGKSKQQFHKAQGSFVKASTEEIKVAQDIVEFDTQNVELAIKGEKLNQSVERLRQEQVKTIAAQNETVQLVLKIEATEQKRDAEIQRIHAQTSGIIQKFLTSSIKGEI